MNEQLTLDNGMIPTIILTDRQTDRQTAADAFRENRQDKANIDFSG